MQLERRRAERDRRVGGRVSVVCAVRNTVGGHLQLGQSEDLGPGGITLRRPCGMPVTPHTQISLSFDLPGTHTTIDLDGMVITDRRHGSFRRTGIRFIRPSSEQVAILSEFCCRKR
jgi:hypothetical protein